MSFKASILVLVIFLNLSTITYGMKEKEKNESRRMNVKESVGSSENSKPENELEHLQLLNLKKYRPTLEKGLQCLSSPIYPLPETGQIKKTDLNLFGRGDVFTFARKLVAINK